MSPITTNHPIPPSSSQPLPYPSKPIKRQPPTHPMHVPIPPSLIQSPYLLSPESIFRRSASSPCLPSKEDEEWLRDTVPLQNGNEQQPQSPTAPTAPEGRQSTRSHLFSLASTLTNGDEKENPTRGRSTQPRVLSNVPLSPPLVRWCPSTPPANPWPKR
jgi:hypothetical protein